MIREELPEDISAVRGVNTAAFGRVDEANLVDQLRAHCADLVSLVAVETEQIVGHVLFSPVTVESEGRVVTGMGLAPMAVLPEYQRQGLGSALVRRGLELLRERGCPYVIVLGHPRYYPRFGFLPATRLGLRCQWESVPDAAFMAMHLDQQAMAEVSGIAQYRPEFNLVT